MEFKVFEKVHINILRKNKSQLNMSNKSNISIESKISVFTSAGKPPILPNSILVNGIIFDDATPSLKSKNKPNFDFSEEFKSKLFPVCWESIDPSKYGLDKIGKTFTVNGKVSVNNDKYDTHANITITPPVIISTSNNSVTFEKVQLTDKFWAPKQKVNALNSLNKAIFQISEPSGGEPNFDNSIKKLKGENHGQFDGFVFQDSDIYKSIEAISYTLSATRDDKDSDIKLQREKLQKKLDNWIEKIEKVQYADGYIDTFFTLRSEAHEGGCSPATHRFYDMSNHELYNCGHFLECVVAYTRFSFITKQLENYAKNMKEKMQVLNTSTLRRHLLIDVVKILNYERVDIMEMFIHKIKHHLLKKQMLLVILFELVISTKVSLILQQCYLKITKTDPII